MGKVDIQNNGDVIGWLSWDSPMSAMKAEASLRGARVRLPVSLELRGIDDEPWGRPKDDYVRTEGNTTKRKLSWGVLDLSCAITLQGAPQIHVGLARLSGTICAGNQRHTRNHQFVFDFSGEELERIESLRNGSDLKLFLEFTGTSFFLVNDGYEWRTNSMCEPWRFNSGRQAVDIAREPWVDALRNAGICESILVELPLFRKPDEAWAGVWDGLCEARERFRLGMWKDVVMQVRAAFDAWQVRYAETGLGWYLPDIGARGNALDKITKEERLQALLFVAKRFTDKPSHPRGENWTRDDAVLALTLCTSLWNAIRPHDGA